MDNIRERAKSIAADAKSRNTRCDCYLCKEKEAKELLESVQQILAKHQEREESKSVVLKFGSKR
jgi:hypothetical protein